MQPLVSVIIPVYNRLMYINAAIESVLSQSYSNYEIIVVDDGSTVDVKAHLEQYSGGFVYLRKENGGLASARNFAARWARGEFFAFLDDDDLFCPEKLERQIASMLVNPEAALIYSDEYQLDESGRLGKWPMRKDRIPTLPSGYIAREFFMDSFIGVMTVLVRRSVFQEMGGFDESLRYNEDDDLWFRIMLEYPVICSEYVSGARRLHDANMSRDRNKMVYYQLKCVEKYLTEYPAFCRDNSDVVLTRINSLIVGYLRWSLNSFRLPSLQVLSAGRFVTRKLKTMLDTGIKVT